MKPIYIVSGWMRSGTSMMIRALEAGGMEAVYTPGHPDYELSKEDYRLNRSPELYEGKVVKSLRFGTEQMWPWPGGYRVVFMDRDSRE